MATSTTSNKEKWSKVIVFLELLHNKDTKLTRYKAIISESIIENSYIAEKTIFIRDTKKLKELLLNYECCEEYIYIKESTINPPEPETQKELYNLLQIELKEKINLSEKDKIISFMKPSLSPQSSIHNYIYIYKILIPIPLLPLTPQVK